MEPLPRHPFQEPPPVRPRHSRWHQLPDPGFPPLLRNTDLGSYAYSLPSGSGRGANFMSHSYPSRTLQPPGYTLQNYDLPAFNRPVPYNLPGIAEQTQISSTALSTWEPIVLPRLIQSIEEPPPTLRDAYECPSPQSVVGDEACISREPSPSLTEGPVDSIEIGERANVDEHAKGRGRPRKHPQPKPRPLLRPRKTRSRRGCITCRTRKKRCDEAKPYCANCSRSGYMCAGYTPVKIFKNNSCEKVAPARATSPILQLSASQLLSFVGAPEPSLVRQSSWLNVEMQNPHAYIFGAAIQPFINTGTAFRALHVRYILQRWPSGVIHSHNLDAPALKLSCELPSTLSEDASPIARFGHQIHCLAVAAHHAQGPQFCYLSWQLPGDEGYHWKLSVIVGQQEG